MKNLFRISTLVVITLFFSFTNTTTKTIVIDVSHGGKDQGTKTDYISEKQITLQIANRIQKLNENKNLKIILTRELDRFITLSDRVKFINSVKPDYLISLHTNFSKKADVKGTEYYIYGNNKFTDKSIDLAYHLKKEFQNNKMDGKIKTGNFYLLKNVSCPSTLIELGYLSNEDDKELLVSNKGQKQIAETIYKVLN